MTDSPSPDGPKNGSEGDQRVGTEGAGMGVVKTRASARTGQNESLAGLMRSESRHRVDPATADRVLAARALNQRYALQFLLWVFAASISMTFLIILLQGFKAWGFELPPDFLRWLGGAVIAEVAAILGAVITSLFKE